MPDCQRKPLLCLGTWRFASRQAKREPSTARHNAERERVFVATGNSSTPGYCELTRNEIGEEHIMIKLTKFNSDGKKGEFILNAEIIETMEETPDTVITLTNGKKLIVQERMEDIVRKVMVYKRALYK